MTAMAVVLCAAGWVVAMLAVALLPARIGRQHLRQALRLRATVRPYLRRRALEGNIDVPDAPTATMDAIIDDICALAERLTDHERATAGSADTLNTLAVSDTQPMLQESTPENVPKNQR